MSDSASNLDLVLQAQASKEAAINALADASSPATLFGRRQSTTTGLTWGYYGGRINIANVPTAIVNGTLSLTASTTNYVVASRATGAVSVSTATTDWNSSAYIRLYSISTGTATISSYVDHRALMNAESPYGALQYQGGWNASTNTPALTSGVGTRGYYYVVTTAGATALDGYAGWTVGDIAIFNGTTWDKLEGGGINASEIAAVINAAADKATPADADKIAVLDSAASFALKTSTWANVKGALATWLETLTATWSNKTLTNPTINAAAGTLVLPTAATPEQTAEGSVVWDSDNDVLTVGDGVGRKTMVDTVLLAEKMAIATYDADADGIVDAAEAVVILGRNNTGSTIPKMSAVYISGATGQSPTFALAKADAEATSSKTIGIITADMLNNATGFAAITGTLHNYDTSAFVDGDTLWLSATVAGGFTATRPTAPNHAVLIGFVAYAHAVNGKIALNVTNGQELNELHNVLISAVANNQVLQYDSASGTWKNRSTLAGLTLTRAKASATLAEGSNGLEFADAQYVNSQVNLHTDHKLNAMGIDLTESATVGTLTAPSSANNNVGTYNFTISRTEALPDWTPSANVVLYHKHDGATGVILTLLTTGVLRLTMNATNYDSTVANTLPNGATAHIAPIVTRPSVSTAGSVVFKVGEYTLGSAVAIPAGAPANLDNTSPLYLSGTSTTRHASRNHAARVFNRAMTDTEWSLFVQKGVDFADIGATQTTLNVSSFANATYETFSGASATGFSAATSASTGGKSCASADEIVLVDGKRYIVDFDFVLNSGTPPSVSLRSAVGSTVASTVTNQQPVAGHNTITLIASLSTTGVLNFNNAALVASDFQVSNLRIVQAGAITNYEPSGIQPNQWHDSANDNHLAFPASGASLSQWKESGMWSSVVNITGDTTITVPAGYALADMMIEGTNANSVDLRLGTTAGGSEIFAATTCPGNTFTPPVFSRYAFSRTADKTLYLSSPSWASGAAVKADCWWVAIK